MLCHRHEAAYRPGDGITHQRLKNPDEGVYLLFVRQSLYQLHILNIFVVGIHTWLSELRFLGPLAG